MIKILQLVLLPNIRCFLRNSENIPQLRSKHDFFKKLLFPLHYKRVGQSGSAYQKIQKHWYFQKQYLKSILPKPNNVYYCHHPKGIRLLTSLCLGLSLLCVSLIRERKFKHSFQDCFNPLCFCSNETETSTHYLLHCSIYTSERMTLLNKSKVLIVAF